MYIRDFVLILRLLLANIPFFPNQYHIQLCLGTYNETNITHTLIGS